jgi:microcystin-dependent protein
MPTTYSPSLRLSLLATGENSGTWGSITNTNLGALIEQAITGVTNVGMSDAGNTTLTTLDGDVDQARNAVLVLGGNLSANRNLIVPTANKFYTVRNSTTGGFSVVVKTSAGSGVTLANGLTQLMYCDGTNVVLASPPINAATGDLAVSGSIFSNGSPVMPTGSIIEYGGATAPTGWLLCNGAAVSRTTYAALYAVILDIYGAGDGSTTFNVPDRRDRVGVGAGSTYARGSVGGTVTATTSSDGAHAHTGVTGGHALTVDQMPSHNHGGSTSTPGTHGHGSPTYLTYQEGGTVPGYEAGGYFDQIGTGSGTYNDGIHSHDIVTSLNGGGQLHQHSIVADGTHTHTVSTLQPYLVSNFIIKA